MLNLYSDLLLGLQQVHLVHELNQRTSPISGRSPDSSFITPSMLSSPNTPKVNSRILLLSSDPTLMSHFEPLLANGFEVQQVEHHNQAHILLSQDPLNEWTVVVADENQWAGEQFVGFHQMYGQLTALPNHFILFILTSHTNWGELVNLIKSGVPAIPLSREHILHSPQANQQLSDVLSAADHQVRLIIENLPTNFNRSWRKMYKLHRTSPGYLQEEQAISREARSWVEAVLNREKLTDFPIHNFMGKIDRSKNQSLNIANFRTKLLGRRISIGLCQLDRKYLSNYRSIPELWMIILNILRFRDATSTPWDESQVKSLINSHLKLSYKTNYNSRSLMYHPLTLEEKMWLREPLPHL